MRESRAFRRIIVLLLLAIVILAQTYIFWYFWAHLSKNDHFILYHQHLCKVKHLFSTFSKLSQNFFSFLKIFFDLLKKTSEKFQVLPFLSFRGLLLIELIFLLRSSVVYLSLQTILPLLRSYGDISKVTLSPGRILMKFIRSFPLICASTMWPFSSSTLNIALGSFSTTTPSISITSVFDIFNPPA